MHLCTTFSLMVNAITVFRRTSKAIQREYSSLVNGRPITWRKILGRSIFQCEKACCQDKALNIIEKNLTDAQLQRIVKRNSERMLDEKIDESEMKRLLAPRTLNTTLVY